MVCRVSGGKCHLGSSMATKTASRDEHFANRDEILQRDPYAKSRLRVKRSQRHEGTCDRSPPVVKLRQR